MSAAVRWPAWAVALLLAAGCAPAGPPSTLAPLAPDAEPARLAATGAQGGVVARVAVTRADGAAGPGVVTFGHAFAPGQVREAVVARAGGQELPTQVDVKRRHPDGSVRHAVVSVALPRLGRSGLELDLLAAGARRQGGLTVAEALAGGFDAEVEVRAGGAVYRARAADLLRKGPVERWLDGPLATELRVAGPLTGADGAAHPALLVLMDLRFAGPRAVRASITLENAWTDAPGNLTYDLRMAVAGGAAFERAGLEHYHHARLRRVLPWGEGPEYHVRHDLRTLIAAAAVPRYDPRRRVPVSAVGRLHQRWQESSREPLGQGLVHAKMGDPGGRWDIGLLPAWTAISLLSGDRDAYRVMLDCGDRAGSFSVHYRDRGTGRLLSVDEHPTVSLINGKQSAPADRLPECAGCKSPYKPDHEHQPSLAYAPYLLTGDPYYLDELKLWAGWNFVSLDFNSRERERGLLKASKPARAQAWMLRTLAHAAWILPDGDPDLAYFQDKLAGNLRWYREEAVRSNPLGQWGPSTYSIKSYPKEVGWHVRSWQIDFLTAVFDRLVAMGFADAAPTRDWLAANVVGRFQAAPTPLHATAYDLAGGDKEGNWYRDWKTVFELSPAPNPKTWRPKDAFHYQAIARPALAAAVHANLPGARELYDRLDRELEKHAGSYDQDPTWAIVP